MAESTRFRALRDLGRGWLLWIAILAALAMLVILVVVPDLGVRSADRCFSERSEDEPGPNNPDSRWAYYSQPNLQEPPASRPENPIQLSLLPDQLTTLHFGRSESVRALDIDYRPAVMANTSADEATSAAAATSLRGQLTSPALQLDISQFRRDDGAVLSPDLVKTRANVIGDDRVRLSVCVDRRSAHALGDPGTFRGTVSIIDPRVTRADVPLQIDAADPHWPLPFFLVLIAVIAGSWMTWVIREKTPETRFFLPREWFAWGGTAIGIICIVAGSAAAVGTYLTTYLTRETWGTTLSDYATLLTGAFVAFMGVTTSLQVAGLAQAARTHSGGQSASGRAVAGIAATGPPAGGTPSDAGDESGPRAAG